MEDEQLVDQLIQILEMVESSGRSLSAEEEQVVFEIIQDISSTIGVPQIPEPLNDSTSLLWILAGGNEKAFIDYLKTFPDPELNRLANDPVQLKSVISQLSSKITQAHGEVSEGIPKAELNSSNIFGFSYDPKNKLLRVKFQGNEDYGDGPIYEYEGVPAQIFKMFKNGAVPAKTTGQNKWGQWWRGKIPSLGAALHSLIKMAGYPYQKVA